MFNSFSGIWAGRFLLRFTGTLSVHSLIIVSCDSFITLAANITGGDISKHTVEWVQLTGTSVDWLESRFQTEVMFAQTAIRDDKTFRFYIDKGKKTEIHRDILVTAIPREDFSLNSYSSTASVMSNWVDGEQAINIRHAPAYSPYGTATIDNNIRILNWDNPNINYLFENSVKTGNLTISVGTNNYYFGASIGKFYYVQSAIGYGGVHRYSKSNVILLTLDSKVRNIDASEKFISNFTSTAAKLSFVEVIKRELINFEASDEFKNKTLNSTFVQSEKIEVIKRELINFESISENFTASFSSTANVMTFAEIKETKLSSLG